MKIVITGAGSFVAFHLASKLLKSKNKVIGIDKEKNKNIKELLAFSNFDFHKEDITQSNNLSRICKGADIIYHLAAISSERLCRQDPLSSIRVNVLGTLKMLEVSRENKSLFVLSSSGSVYPDSRQAKTEKEAGFTDRFYGTSKLLAEQYCRLYGKNFGFDYVILRFSRIYGPRMRRNPIYDMSMGFAKNKPVKLYESPSSNYDFIFVLDVVEALLKSKTKKWHNKTVNISRGQPIELSRLYEILCAIAKTRLSFKVINHKKGTDVLGNKLAKKLGFKPTYSVKDGLRETLEYFKTHP